MEGDMWEGVVRTRRGSYKVFVYGSIFPAKWWVYKEIGDRRELVEDPEEIAEVLAALVMKLARR